MHQIEISKIHVYITRSLAFRNIHPLTGLIVSQILIHMFAQLKRQDIFRTELYYVFWTMALKSAPGSCHRPLNNHTIIKHYYEVIIRTWRRKHLFTNCCNPVANDPRQTNLSSGQSHINWSHFYFYAGVIKLAIQRDINVSPFAIVILVYPNLTVQSVFSS